MANIFQISEFFRQLKGINNYQLIRKKNFEIYDKFLGIYKDFSLNFNGSFLNYPIIFSSYKHKMLFIAYMMNNGFDVGEYYYRSCNKEKCFLEYRRQCENSEHYSKCVVTLPTHYRIEYRYLMRLADLASNYLRENPDCLIC